MSNVPPAEAPIVGVNHTMCDAPYHSRRPVLSNGVEQQENRCPPATTRRVPGHFSPFSRCTGASASRRSTVGPPCRSPIAANDG